MALEIISTYEVCVDCYWYAGYNEFGDGCPEEIRAAVLSGFGNVLENGNPVSGDHCAEFSKVPCEICGSGLAGARYEVSYLG
jgi:hypothetical protein